MVQKCIDELQEVGKIEQVAKYLLTKTYYGDSPKKMIRNNAGKTTRIL